MLLLETQTNVKGLTRSTQSDDIKIVSCPQPNQNIAMRDMGRRADLSMPVLGKWREYTETFEFYDVVYFLVKLPLYTLFFLGTVCLTLQIAWKKIRIQTQEEIVHKEHEDGDMDIPLRDFTIQELTDYDGVKKTDIYVAVNGKVFDVSSARNYFGPHGPDSVLAGRDASRALVTFSLDDFYKSNDNGQFDDLFDLNPLQRDCLFEYETHYTERYVCVGRLVKIKQPTALEQRCLQIIRRQLTTSTRSNTQVAARQLDQLPLPRCMKNKLLDLNKRREFIHINDGHL